jgi:hypothetical protein
MPVISALRKLSQENHEFEDCLHYVVSSKPAELHSETLCQNKTITKVFKICQRSKLFKIECKEKVVFKASLQAMCFLALIRTEVRFVINTGVKNYGTCK